MFGNLPPKLDCSIVAASKSHATPVRYLDGESQRTSRHGELLEIDLLGLDPVTTAKLLGRCLLCAQERPTDVELGDVNYCSCDSRRRLYSASSIEPIRWCPAPPIDCAKTTVGDRTESSWKPRQIGYDGTVHPISRKERRRSHARYRALEPHLAHARAALGQSRLPEKDTLDLHNRLTATLSYWTAGYARCSVILFTHCSSPRCTFANPRTVVSACFCSIRASDQI